MAFPAPSRRTRRAMLRGAAALGATLAFPRGAAAQEAAPIRVFGP